ncbi:CD1375 family protein [Schinkia azotoformans]|nr:CD1375 family protein [Schinkia azotoformans]MEC1716588.1 CD1375 family protein [Schinkia azotoformans]MEC1739426.1 CD1375 family protein [Schinkia azotoformans]MEC1745504.1 CD1375 family protein [Schinkia azotoformans]MEC1756567.1 CD1375 family protein [Schinkia azotoformans]MEC1765834.1 CD1375 family protein [Schinkia azotoformans]
MAQIYVNLIKKGLKILDEVPQNLKGEVESILAVDHAN